MKDKLNIFLQQLSWHDQCDIKEGDEGPQPHCRYSVLHLESDKEAYFTCGRTQVTMRILELNKPNKNNTIIKKEIYNECK